MLFHVSKFGEENILVAKDRKKQGLVKQKRRKKLERRGGFLTHEEK
jgi:hypothetical protein